MRSAVENYNLFGTSLVANDELVRKSLADAAIAELKAERDQAIREVAKWGTRCGQAEAARDRAIEIVGGSCL